MAQRSQLQARRVRTHAAVAQALEEAGCNLDERAAEIAQHWADAEETGPAAQWHRRAALWAGLSDSVEALRNWRRVRELAAGVEDLDERRALSIEACQQIFFLAWRVGASDEEMASVFAEGRALIEQTGDRPALAKLVALFGAVRLHIAGSAADYLRYSEEALPIAAECDDPALRAAVAGMVLWGYYTSGNGPMCLVWADRVLAETGTDNRFAKEIFGYSARVSAFEIRAHGLAILGRLEEARQHLAVAVHEAETIGEFEVLSWTLCFSVRFAVFHAYISGGPGPVLDQARRALEIAETLDLETSRSVAFAALGVAWLIDGQPAIARDALRNGIAIIRDRRVMSYWLPGILSALAEAHLALGEPAEALDAVREGIERGHAGGTPYQEAHAWLTLARILLASDGNPARQEIEAALGRAEELVALVEGRSLSPRILELRGRLAAALGDTAASEQALREALDLYRDIGATGHAERLAREIAALDATRWSFLVGGRRVTGQPAPDFSRSWGRRNPPNRVPRARHPVKTAS